MGQSGVGESPSRTKPGKKRGGIDRSWGRDGTEWGWSVVAEWCRRGRETRDGGGKESRELGEGCRGVEGEALAGGVAATRGCGQAPFSATQSSRGGPRGPRTPGRSPD